MKTRVLIISKTLVFSVLLNLVACNKSDYFQKDYLADSLNEGPIANGPGDKDDHEDQEIPGGYDEDDSSNNGGESESENQENTNHSGGIVSVDHGDNEENESVSDENDPLTDSSSDVEDHDDLSDEENSGNTDGSIAGDIGDCNQGHGNDLDGIDESNPVIGLEERCKEEKFLQRNNQQDLIDIVWIVDNSGSMEDEQSSLAKNFGSFIDSFLQKNVDFTMSILTTDRERNQRSYLLNESYTRLNSNRAKTNLNDFENTFMDLIQVGTNGSSKEQGLGALSDFINNQGKTFLRKDAQLAVICITDEEDQSNLSIDQLILNLNDLKGGLEKIKFYSIVDKELKNRGRSITTGYERYADVSNATQGLILGIENDFHQSLNIIGETIVNLLDSFQLKNTPEISSIKVFVQGLEVKNFVYIQETNSIKFLEGSIPNQGSEITVRYKKIN